MGLSTGVDSYASRSAKRRRASDGSCCTLGKKDSQVRFQGRGASAGTFRPWKVRMRKSNFLLAAGVIGLLLAGCGRFPGNGPISGGGANTAPVSLTMTDTPPSGVSVISFRISVTGAVLQPGNVSLLSLNNPLPVEITQLQTRNAILGTANVVTGVYNSLTLTFSSATLTILNESGSAIGTCLNGAVCVLTPAISPMTVTFSSTPFPITLSQNIPVGLQVDVNLSTILQSDLSANLSTPSGVTLTQLPAAALNTELALIDNITGVVQSKGTNQFTLKNNDATSFIINTDSVTQFDFSAINCTANDLTCVTTGQILSIDASLLGSGSLFANQVTLNAAAGKQLVTGTITGVSTFGNVTTIQLVVLGEEPSIPNILAGDIASVTLQNNTAFSIDSSNFTIPGGFSFQAISDLAVGQKVQVHVAGTVTTTPSLSFPTDSVALEPADLSGTVGLVNAGAGTFTINNLPALFTGGIVSPAAQIQVQTTSQTAFDNLTPNSFTAIIGGNLVSVGGWVFSTPSGTTPLTIVAKEVRGRTISGP